MTDKTATATATVSKDEAIAILQAELDGIEAEMKGWVDRMHAANRQGFEQFCNDVIALKPDAFVGDWAGVGALLVLAKANLLERLIEHEKSR
jgi:hypothetical protein